MSGYNSSKRSGKIPGNMLRFGSGSDMGEALGNTIRYDSSKVLGSDLCKESGTVLDKGPGKCPGKNSGKEARQDKTCKIRRFLSFGVNLS
jgi:hypothetical protein